MRRSAIAVQGLLLSLLVLVVGPSPLQAGEVVYLYNEADVDIKPCFQFEKGGPWVDFGNVAAGGSFAWADFLAAVEDELGLPADSLTSASVSFTYVASPGNCPEDGAKGQAKLKIEPEINNALQVGGRMNARTLRPPP